MSRWSPRELPRARSQTWQILAYGDPSGNRPDLNTEFVRYGAQIATADLYWVTPDMTALAVAAGRDLSEVCWSAQYRPSRSGLVVFDGGICRGFDVSGVQAWPPDLLRPDPFRKQGRPPKVEVPLDAASWRATQDGEVEVTAWLRWRVMRDALSAAGARSDLYERQMPPLVPIRSWLLPCAGEPLPVSEIPVKGNVERVVSLTIVAAWLLMQQPTLAERSIERADRADARRAARAGFSDPDVTIVDLRKIYRPQDPAEDGDGSSRVFRHRWVVSGHWRNQPFGKGREQRRQQWIPSYTKGPDGAPLLETERVNVWRR